MYTANSSILYRKEKNGPDTGHVTSIVGFHSREKAEIKMETF